MTATAVERRDLKGMNRADFARVAAELGTEPYRAEQIMRWVYQRDVRGPAEMSNLPKALRAVLEERFRLTRLEEQACERSADGTVKLLLGVEGGFSVEAVMIPEGARRTACISSQAGCGIGCTFCATALGGLGRNLTAGEIVDQVAALQRATGERITNVVFMGMGEPFANYREVMKAARLLNDPWAFGIGARHITISTSGVAPAIERFAREGVQFVLALSLHAGTDEVRDRLVPLNRKYPLDVLMKACRYYVEATRRRITFEYVLIKGVNDGTDQADGLIRRVEGLLCHVNLIPLNPVPETGFERPDEGVVRRFARRIERSGIQVTVRKERGADIQAACGQLRRSRAR